MHQRIHRGFADAGVPETVRTVFATSGVDAGYEGMQMIRFLRVMVAMLVALPLAAGEALPQGLAHLVRAQQELGTSHWSSLICSASEDPDGRTAALVFEFSNALWFYRPAEGTQSLSRHWNNVEAERQNLLPLLQAIDPAYVGFREITPEERASVVPVTAELPNGCFVQSVGQARRLEQSGQPANGCLVSYYASTARGQQGHTVLTYEDAAGRHIFDPADGTTTAAPRTFAWTDEGLKLARELTPAALARRLTKAAKIALWGSDDAGARSGTRGARRGAACLR